MGRAELSTQCLLPSWCGDPLTASLAMKWLTAGLEGDWCLHRESAGPQFVMDKNKKSGMGQQVIRSAQANLEAEA